MLNITIASLIHFSVYSCHASYHDVTFLVTMSRFMSQLLRSTTTIPPLFALETFPPVASGTSFEPSLRLCSSPSASQTRPPTRRLPLSFARVKVHRTHRGDRRCTPSTVGSKNRGWAPPQARRCRLAQTRQRAPSRAADPQLRCERPRHKSPREGTLWNLRDEL